MNPTDHNPATQTERELSDAEAHSLLEPMPEHRYNSMQSAAGEDIVFKPSMTENYSSDIRPYFNSSQFGGIAVDAKEVAELYIQALQDRKGFYGDLDDPQTVSYNFGAAIGNVCSEEIESLEIPDIENSVDKVMKRYSEFYYDNPKTMAVKKGAYDWLIHIEEQSLF